MGLSKEWWDIHKSNNRFKYPSLCFDNFYNNPHAVRNFALSLDGWSNKYGSHPGLRSMPIEKYDKEFYRKSVDKFMSLFDDWRPTRLKMRCSTFFQKIYRFSNDPDDPVNNGWIHTDGNVDIAGVVYLDPNPLSDNGTSIYYPKGDIENFKYINVLENNDGKIPPQYERILGIPEKSNTVNYCEIDDIKWYRKNIVTNNSQYETTVEIKNFYNRCIAYSGNQLHSATNYWMPNDDDFRLFQVFFIYYLQSPPEYVTSNRVSGYHV